MNKAKVTPTEAKELWDKMENPTTRKVGETLGVSHATVARWQRHGWIVTPTEVSAAPKKEPAPVASKADVVEVDDVYAESRKVEATLDGHIIETQRKVHYTIQLLLHEIGVQRGKLIKTSAKDLGALLNGISNLNSTVNRGIQEAMTLSERTKKYDQPHDDAAENAPLKTNEPYADLLSEYDKVLKKQQLSQ